jgi:hypothetical protein
MMRQQETISSYIRVLHASPDAPGVDVYSNGKLIARNLVYGKFTPYLKVPPGSYTIEVYRTGTMAKPVIRSSATLRPKSIYTVAATGRMPNVELFVIPDSMTQVPSNRANLRFVHLSPNIAAVDVALPDGKTLFRGTGYKGITGYQHLPPGKHALEIKTAGTNNVILTVPNILLKAGRNYSAYAVGLLGEKPGLQLLIALDGSTYIKA